MDRGEVRRAGLVVALVCAALATGCAREPAGPGQVTAAATGGPPPTFTMTTPGPRPATPTATSIPGYEGWTVINPQDVQIQTDDKAVVMTLTHKALWFMGQRGVLLYKPVSGNFRITADVHTSKSSDTSQPPGGKGSVQLGGVMLRNGGGVQENYVFIVVGDDGSGLSVETKNTVNSLSKFDGPEWGSADAELRLCRVGSNVSAYKRHAGSGEPWMPAGSFDRPDLPLELQAGLNIYTDGAPALQARYEHVSIEPITTADDCVK